MTDKKKKIYFIVACVIVLIFVVYFIMLDYALSSWSEKDYLPPITINVPDSDVVLVVKEWRKFPSSCGSDIYVLQDGKERYLAHIKGGYDAHNYFKSGTYNVIDNGDGSITVQVWQYNQHHEKVNITERDYTIPMR